LRVAALRSSCNSPPFAPEYEEDYEGGYAFDPPYPDEDSEDYDPSEPSISTLHAER
jgi:hypothetical protein